MRQLNHQKVDLAFDTADDRKGFAKVCLGMTRWMSQRYEHLPLTLPGRKDVILHNGDAASISMLVTQPFEHPLRRMLLLPGNGLISFQNRIDDPDEGIQLLLLH